MSLMSRGNNEHHLVGGYVRYIREEIMGFNQLLQGIIR